VALQNRSLCKLRSRAKDETNTIYNISPYLSMTFVETKTKKQTNKMYEA
jgi:hypothetical protein